MRTFLVLCLFFFFGCLAPQAPKVESSASQESSCEEHNASELSDPQNIEEAVAFINALPKPLELKCFIKALKRPLHVNATTSTLSVQRAKGESSPRIFIFKGDLVMAIKPDGDGTYLLEFGEFLSDMRTIKAEIELPVYREVKTSETYRQINNGERTSCSACHLAEREERLTEEGDPVYSSYALKPTESQKLPFTELQNQQYLCELQNEKSRRCSVFYELLTNGEVLHQEFPENTPTMTETFNL